jgi:hypothetical protein
MLSYRADAFISRVIFACVCLQLPQAAHAQFENLFPGQNDYRSEALGEIQFTTPDEKNALNLFNFGNPCGSVFLPAQNRLDYGLQGQVVNNYADENYLSLGGTGGGYQGALLRPTDNLAIQLGTQARLVPNAVDTPDYFVRDSPKFALGGGVACGYEFLPGWAAGISYDYAHSLQDSPDTNPLSLQREWQVGIGWQAIENILTVGLSVGQSQSNIERIYSFFYSASYQGGGQSSQYSSQIQSNKLAVEDQSFLNLQTAYSPTEHITLGCVLTYMNVSDKIQERNQSLEQRQVEYVPFDPAASYTELTTTETVFTTEEDTWKVVFKPVVRFQVPITEEVEANVQLGFHYQKSGTRDKKSGTSQETSVRNYDTGIQVTSVGQPGISNFNLGESSANLHDGEVSVVAASKEKSWLVGARFFREGISQGANYYSWQAGAGAEYWLLPEVAIRVGARAFTDGGLKTPVLNCGFGWENPKYQVNVFYSWEDTSFYSQIQLAAAGVTLIL